MRAHNEAGGDIGFHGFDMQVPGMALHNVREYIREVDPGRTAVVAGQLHCLTVFANDHRGRWPPPGYYGYRDQPKRIGSCAEPRSTRPASCSLRIGRNTRRRRGRTPSRWPCRACGSRSSTTCERTTGYRSTARVGATKPWPRTRKDQPPDRAGGAGLVPLGAQLPCCDPAGPPGLLPAGDLRGRHGRRGFQPRGR